MILFLLFAQNFVKGYRLNSTVTKYVHARTGVECIFLCMREDKSCRSINFRKISSCDKNCELLRDVDSEKPELLLQDEQFDHYILLGPSRVCINRSCKKKYFYFQMYPTQIFNWLFSLIGYRSNKNVRKCCLCAEGAHPGRNTQRHEPRKQSVHKTLYKLLAI